MNKREKAPAGDRPAEPQSYGSQKDWLHGKTGQTVDRTPHKSDRHDEAFYDDRRTSETSEAPNGGMTSPFQTSESELASRDTSATDVVGSGARKVATDSDRRVSYWRERDYR